jgi:hypothetical protein
MLLQTNSYVVPKEKRAEHARLMRRFRQTLMRLGCDQFEVYEQVGANWTGGDTNGRFVQIMRFADRKQQLAVQNAERTDPTAQSLIAEFCEMVNFPYQQQQGLFAVGFYQSVLPTAPSRIGPAAGAEENEPEEAAGEAIGEPAVGEPIPEEISAVEQAPDQGHADSAAPGDPEDVEFGDEPGGEEAA